MSEKDDQTEEQTSEIADAEFEEPPAEPDEMPDVALSPPAKRSFAGVFAALALIVSLAAAAGVGLLYLDIERAEDSEAQSGAAIAGLDSRVQSAQNSISDLSEALASVESDNQPLNSNLNALCRDLDERASLFDSVPPRMTSLERTVATLQGVSVDARNTYLVAEAEYYMQIANAQLQLAGNPYLASLALEQADDRLVQLGDPALTDVRRALADELAALEVMEKPDVAGVTLTLASLAQVVESMPLRKAATSADADADVSDEESSGAGRAWESVKDAMSGLVKHTPPGDEQAPLLTPDAEGLIRSNLALQLQAARLALLRGEQQIFEQSIDDAGTWTRAYFDGDSEAVIAMLQTLTEIRADYSSVVPPDISTSLRLLRQYKTLAEGQQ